MEGLQSLKYMLQKGDYMCNLDLKDAYFSVPLEKNSRQFVRFRWSGNLYELLCLCFGLGPALRIFTKLLKVSMTILCRINIKIITYLDDMLLIGHSLEEILMNRDIVVFLLQHLGFVINWKKSVLTPVHEIEFMGLAITSVTLELSLNKAKIQKVVSECKNWLNNPQTSVLELTELIGLLTSTIQAVLLARLNWRFLQIKQISSLSENLSYLDEMFLSKNSESELKWWVQNSELSHGGALIQPPAEVLIQTDASTRGWGGGGGNMQWNQGGCGLGGCDLLRK